MPNLVGIGLSQVPTNSMLGGMAYQDPEHASIKDLDLKNISQINSEISDTATDIFVYDTRKDSDGGAWRKRTQHTSWYNETLNTATRGSRREFPAVAVIVISNDTAGLTIYDGDDPNLPMWMVFNETAGQSIWQGTDRSSVAALNGIIVVGQTTTIPLPIIGFVADEMYNRRTDTTKYNISNIAGRNASGYSISGYFDQGLVNTVANDVAMTLLPNAPIDDATGLPIPTIAVATNGGVSVIKDDGTVINGGDTASISDIHISKENRLYYTFVGYSQTREVFGPGSWTSSGFVGSHQMASTSSYPTLPTGSGNGINITTGAYGKNAGLFLHDPDPTDIPADPDNNNGMVAYATTSYNTGWMHGDIKGAFLSDTTVESFSPSNLVTEDFSANWTGATNGVLSVSSGQLTITNSGGGNGRAISNTFSTTGGKKYAFIVKAVSNSSATYRLEVRGPELVATGTTNGQILVVYFNGTGNSSTYVELYAIGSSGASATYEDAYVVELEEDRSVNNKGLQVFGTITKSAVATGAELVAYSGFSNSTNYLSQPLNSDLAIGNSDFSCVGWFKKSTSSNTGMIIFASDENNQVFDVRVHTDMKMLAQITDDGFSTREIVSTQGSTVNDDLWHQFHVVRRSNILYSYLDGNLLGSSSSVEANITNSMGITIGAENLSGNAKAFEGSLALIRFSKSAPSPEQIKKMYEDEKHLFQENAKATLYGSSDAVTALGYDDSSNILHVGTSAGRSEFQGLCRINNTIEAVTTAISASNGLVAEQ